MCPARLLLAAMVVLVAWCARGTWAQGFDAVGFERDLRALAGHESRVVGSPGYSQALRYLEGELAALPESVQVHRHTFRMIVPVTRVAQLTFADGTGGAVHPFWPAGVRVNSTPTDGLRGRLVYCGTGELSQWRPKDLFGQIAVIEASSGSAWQQAFSFGARAVIVLGASDTTHVHLREHDLLIPANLPRFYVPPGALAERLRRGVEGEATLVAQVSWEPREAVNLYALVPPVGGANERRRAGAVTITSSLDSSGLVPDLAAGASQAVQPAAALGLLRHFAGSPVDRPVLVCFTSGDGVQFLGTRQMLMALADAPATWRRELAQSAPEHASAEADLSRMNAIGDDPSKLDLKQDRRLIDRIIKLIEADATEAQDELFRLRRARESELTPELIARRDELDRLGIRLNKLRYAFQSGPGQLVGSPSADEAAAVMDRVRERLQRLVEAHRQRRGELEQRVGLYRWLAQAVGRDPDPSERETGARLIDVLIGMDLSDRGVRVGPMFYGTFQRSNALMNVQDYREWWARVSSDADTGVESAGWVKNLRRWIDFEPLSQIRSPQAYLSAPIPIPTEMAQAWGVPGLSLVSLDDLRLRRDTPADTLEYLDVAAVVPQASAVHELIARAVRDPRFANRVEPKRMRATIEGQVVSAASGRPVPDLPRDGFVVGYYYLQNASRRIRCWRTFRMSAESGATRSCRRRRRALSHRRPAQSQPATGVFRTAGVSHRCRDGRDFGHQRPGSAVGRTATGGGHSTGPAAAAAPGVRVQGVFAGGAVRPALPAGPGRGGADRRAPQRRAAAVEHAAAPSGAGGFCRAGHVDVPAVPVWADREPAGAVEHARPVGRDGGAGHRSGGGAGLHDRGTDLHRTAGGGDGARPAPAGRDAFERIPRGGSEQHADRLAA